MRNSNDSHFQYYYKSKDKDLLMRKILTAGMSAFILIFWVSSSWATTTEEKAALNILTSSYMVRYYAYLGDDISNLSISTRPESEIAKAEESMAALQTNKHSNDINSAWQQYISSIEATANAWIPPGTPTYHHFDDIVVTHRALVDQLFLVAGETQEYKDTLELLVMMEFYMHRSTPIAYISTPEDNLYELADESTQFDTRIQAMSEQKLIKRGDKVRWKYIKPLMQTSDYYNAPIVMLRHGGHLAKSMANH